MRKNNFLSWLMFFSFLLSTLNIQAQEIKVSGKVTDSKGEPIPGVEIIIVGTKKGTVTDFDGLYSLKANKGDQLKASAVGMKSQVKTVTGPKLDFVLQDDALGLDEVVVTAQSGIVTKKQLGSVINSVKAKDLAPRTVANISEALQGALPGAQIMRNNGSAAPSISIRLRGPSTVLGSSSPLIMIDGMIINNDERSTLGSGGTSSADALSDIDMNDIDHIEVVKGPAASAMYGSMASNGIIQIFTKKGKTGKPSITVTSSYNINQIRKFKPYNKALTRWEDPGDITNTNQIPVEKRYDYQSYVFRKGLGMYNGVKINGGTEYTTYNIGGSILSNDGIVRNSNYKRKNLDLKLGQKLTDNLKLNLGVIYSNNTIKELPYGGNAGPTSPTLALLFDDNYISPMDSNGNYTPMAFGNPYEDVDLVEARNDVNRVITNFSLNFKPIEGLNIDYIFGYDYTGLKGKFYAPYHLTSVPDGKLTHKHNYTGIFSSHIKANYNYKITDNIKASTGAGYQYLYNNKEEESSNKPKLSIFPNLQNMDGATDISTNSSNYEYAIWGTWIQQHFGIYDKLFLTFGGRWDKASTFGDDVQAFYPKVSGSLVLSDFDFWQENIGKYVNSFKLRGAWGEAGNMSVLTSPSYINTKEGALYIPGSYLGQTTYVPASKDGNKNIRPEVTREREFGFDAGFLNGKIGIEFTIYHQDVKDLVLERNMGPSTGSESRVDNVGTLTNDGIEIGLNASPIKKKDFDWNFSINYSRNRNKVSGIEGGKIGLAGSWGFAIAANDQPLGIFYGRFYATDENGNWVLDNNGLPQIAKGIMIDRDGDGFAESYEQQFDSNGQPTGDPLSKVIADSNPDYIVGFNNNIRYKNLTFGFTLEAVQGFDVVDWDKRLAFQKGGWEFTQWELENNKKGWYSSRYGIWESFIEDGSFVKLRNVSLSYDWKKPFKGIKGAKFTISGSNLISWDNYWGYDPETSSWGNQTGSSANEFGNIPIPKVYTFAVQLKF